MKTHPLDRRTLLRGAGISLALPWLDAMASSGAQTGPASAPARLVAIYLGNGMNMAEWTPGADGALVLPATLSALAPVRNQLLVVSGLDNRLGGSSEMGGLHSRIQPAWLTGTHARRTEGSDVEAGVSMDQVAAGAIGDGTPLRSLELALESVEISRACEPAFACTYVSTIAWRDRTTPLPMDADPRSVFERLFGDGRTPAAQAADRRRDRSILDSVTADLAALSRRVGTRDRATVAGYVDAIREVERHISTAEQQAAREPVAADVAGFTGIPISYRDHARLMFELLALALQADTTRVATLLMVRERSDRMFPESGVSEGSHAVSHHEGDPARLARQAMVNRYHVGLAGEFPARLQSMAEGAGSLLDRTVVLFGAGMSDSNQHRPVNVPTLVAGGRALGVKGGRHLRVPAGTPLANLQLTLLDTVGTRVEQHGDSTGHL
ncbi:MAG: DUF1552 domain-containing protein, partial [Acidobacteria bacterium]|nr:DUF1552 domain-containing protein [Acidobacteriota bacterium]